MKKHGISIVIRTHNQGKLLERLIKKIQSQKKEDNIEIIVVDSSSTDNTPAIARENKCKLISINPKKFTHAYTFNLGAKNSRNETIVFASVDIVPKGDMWLHNLVSPLKDKKTAAVFSRQIPFLGVNPSEEYRTLKVFPKKGESLAFSNASSAIKKELWEKEKFDEKVPVQYIGGEDCKWANYWKNLGYAIKYEPSSEVYHSHRYSFKTKLSGAYNSGYYRKECEKWNDGVFILQKSKIDLLKYFAKNKYYRSMIIDLFVTGLFLRIATFFGRFNRKIRDSF